MNIIFNYFIKIMKILVTNYIIIHNNYTNLSKYKTLYSEGSLIYYRFKINFYFYILIVCKITYTKLAYYIHN